MTLIEFADLADVIGALGVIAGLIFVGLQLRQNTIQMRRTEKNATNAEASAIRQALLTNGELAELVHAGVHETRALGPVEADRFDAFLWEFGYLGLQFYDRSRYGLFDRVDEYERTLRSFAPYLTSTRGRIWWRTARTVLRADFVADLERLMPAILAPVAAPTAERATT